MISLVGHHIYSVFVVWGFSVVLCCVLVLTKKWHGVLTLDQSSGIQKFHTAPTPRIGGLPVFLSLVAVSGTVVSEVSDLLSLLLIAGLPAFAFGVAEDLTKRVGVMTRLLATMASGVLAWWLSGISLTHVGLPGVDQLLRWLPFSLAFTAFAVGGLANAINIVDGFNGLASLTAIFGFLGFAGVAWAVGDAKLALLCLLLAAAVMGFFAVNWPFGKLFLGDGGSYFIGFSLAWVAVLLLERNAAVSPFAALLVCIHPVTEVLFSVYRRKVRKEHPGQPDRLHFHSLLKRRYVSRWLSHLPSTIRNSVAGLMVGSMTLPAALLAQWVHGDHWASAGVVLALILGYVALYARMVRHRWCSPLHFLLPRRMTA